MPQRQAVMSQGWCESRCTWQLFALPSFHACPDQRPNQPKCRVRLGDVRVFFDGSHPPPRGLVVYNVDASRAAWVRLFNFNCCKIAETCSLIVCGDRKSASAISLFDLP